MSIAIGLIGGFFIGNLIGEYGQYKGWGIGKILLMCALSGLLWGALVQTLFK